MPLAQLLRVDVSVGGPLLLEQAELALERGERVCVVGRNGAGKSTLLRLLAREANPDAGEVRFESGVRVASLPQEVPQQLVGRVDDVVASGLGSLGALLADYHAALVAVAHGGDPGVLSAAQARVEAAGAWSLETRLARTLEAMALPADADFASLSGGLKRRVLLARALVAEPDLLLLDEPTNHLDIEAIAWLEELLRGFAGSVVFVTHDRRFLRALATRIVEIDRGRLTSWPGDYENYLRRREERAHAEAQAQAHFDRRLAQEEAWIRQGIKARRTRNEGRVRALEAMRRERARRREATGDVKLAAAGAQASGRRVVELRGANVAFGGRSVLRDVDLTVLRGDRVGLIGANGSGKTTLLRVMLGELVPDSGSVELGTQLEVAYFDQYRATLREDWNALDNVAEGAEFIEVGGARKHVLGYLQDFLFTPERARAPITRLSGGERNRLLLAKILARPSNLLVLDEPTNDLDVETLELLEEMLASYAGTLLLVSHDREFLDNVVTSTIAIEPGGRVTEQVGGYSDWLRQRREAGATTSNAPQRVDAKASSDPTPSPERARRLSYKEQRELAELPARIEALEADLARRHAELADPGFYRREAAAIAAARSELAAREAELTAAYARWEALEAR